MTKKEHLLKVLPKIEYELPLKDLNLILEAMQAHTDEQLILSGVRVSFLEKKLKKAEQALNDIVKWDDDLEDVWGDPGERANSALEHNASMDGF